MTTYDFYMSDSGSASSGGEVKDTVSDNLQQSAYMCIACKFMSLTESDMKSHVREKHKVKQESETTEGSTAAGMTLGNFLSVCVCVSHSVA